MAAFNDTKGALSVREIHDYVNEKLGGPVAESSVRSYLQLNTPKHFERISRGTYRMVRK